jgi:hypothetical protein
MERRAAHLSVKSAAPRRRDAGAVRRSVAATCRHRAALCFTRFSLGREAPVSQLLAGDPSVSGRSPDAARERACEARAQGAAPALRIDLRTARKATRRISGARFSFVPLALTPHEAPLGGRGDRTIVLLLEICQDRYRRFLRPTSEKSILAKSCGRPLGRPRSSLVLATQYSRAHGPNIKR